MSVSSFASPSPRGAFRIRESYHGVATFKSFTCKGHLYETRALPEHAVGDGFWVIDQMNANLNHHDVCPADAQEHGHRCPFDAHRVALTIERGAATVALVRAESLKAPGTPG